MVYLTTQDWPTIYKLSLEDPLAERPAGSRGRAASGDAGRTAYEQRCQSCHGVNGVRSGSGPPALAGVGSRLGFDAFRRVVLNGRAEMPAFPDVDYTTLNAILTFLGNAGGGPRSLQSPAVVASGKLRAASICIQLPGRDTVRSGDLRIRKASILLAIVTTHAMGAVSRSAPSSLVHPGPRSWPMI